MRRFHASGPLASKAALNGMWHVLSPWKGISGKTEDDDGRTSWSSPEVKDRLYIDVIRYRHEQAACFVGQLKETREVDGWTAVPKAK